MFGPILRNIRTLSNCFQGLSYLQFDNFLIKCAKIQLTQVVLLVCHNLNHVLSLDEFPINSFPIYIYCNKCICIPYQFVALCFSTSFFIITLLNKSRFANSFSKLQIALLAHIIMGNFQFFWERKWHFNSAPTCIERNWCKKSHHVFQSD